MKVLVVYYSMYGHVYQLAKGVAAGAASVEGANVEIRRVPRLCRGRSRKDGALETLEAQKDVPVCAVSELRARMQSFSEHQPGSETCADRCGNSWTLRRLWPRERWSAKLAAFSPVRALQHGGQESTILSFHITLLHQGMVVAGLPYAFQDRHAMMK